MWSLARLDTIENYGLSWLGRSLARIRSLGGLGDSGGLRLMGGSASHVWQSDRMESFLSSAGDIREPDSI
jgi:hypothetical protein